MNWEVGGVADPPGMARIWPAIVAEGGSMSHAGGFRMAVGLCVRLQVFGTPKCVLQRCIAERNRYRTMYLSLWPAYLLCLVLNGIVCSSSKTKCQWLNKICECFVFTFTILVVHNLNNLVESVKF
jgi:hypothetical protein